MGEKLTAEEVATLIRARKIAKAKGLRPDLDVKAICEAGGISRKTGYQWAEKLGQGPPFVLKPLLLIAPPPLRVLGLELAELCA